MRGTSQEETVTKSSSADLASEELLQKRVRTDVPPPNAGSLWSLSVRMQENRAGQTPVLRILRL